MCMQVWWCCCCCRRFIPADVAHLRDDMDALTRLFFAEGDGLQMQVRMMY
jgi:hypothetical protein